MREVLVVDDDATSRLTLRFLMERAGYTVVEAENGLAAWNLLREHAFALVVADWLMPVMDGLELCRRIRSTVAPGGIYTYIILLTSKFEREDRLAGLAAGADDFMVKPPAPDELAARLGVADRILRMETELREANILLAERRQNEIQIGGNIQRALLMARPPEESNLFEFAVMNLPSSQIDGDFFDFFVHRPGVVDVFVGDAMGKGVPAALVGAGTKSFMLRALSTLLADHPRDHLPRPVEIVQNVHDGLSGQLMRLGSFVTLGYARLDVPAHKATFVDAGHTKAIHLHTSTRVAEIVAGENFPIGFTDRETYAEVERTFEDGDLFVFYSDGVTEARSPEHGLFGVVRLQALLSEHANDSPSQLLYRLRESVRAYTGDRPMDDDFTCVMVRVGKTGGEWSDKRITLVSALSSLEALRRFVGESAVACRLDGPLIDALQIAAHEAATNIVRHAHRNRSDETIEIVAERLSPGIRVSLFYDAEPFDPPPATALELSPDMEGGMGLFIIRASVDEVVYSHDHAAGRSTVSLVKGREA